MTFPQPREVNGTVRAFDKLFTHSTIKAITYLYSQTEVGVRHPDGPLGLMLRDQGQTDLYAGKSRILLTVDGTILNLATAWATRADRVVLQTPHLSNLYFNGRVLNPDVFSGKKLAGIKEDAPNNIGLVTSDLLIDTRTGRIISGFVEFNKVFEPRQVFDDPQPLDAAGKRQFDLWAEALGVKR